MLQGLVLAAFLAAAGWAAGVEQAAVPPYVFTLTPRYEPAAWLQGLDRFPAGASVMLAAGQARRGLAPGFFASADPAVSYDGAKVLFAGKRSQDARWQIWETTIAGGTPRQITSGSLDCVGPLYLPDGRIVYTLLSAHRSDLEVVSTEGGKPERLTFTPAWRITDDVLRDGRILFEEAQGGVRELFTVYPDGTGVESLRCDHGPDRSQARQILSGDVIFNVGGHFARFASALAVQADVPQPDAKPAGPIAESADGAWIVAVRRAASGPFGLAFWRGGKVTELESPVNANAVQPAIVATRTPPREFPSALVPTRTAGNLLCLNARASKASANADASSVRVFTQDAAGAPVLLGQTGLERDGSFYVQVPPDRPLRIELLNGAGSVVRAEHGWFWMRPSEQRICVGCHVGPEWSPENKVPEILLRTTVPVSMLGHAGSKP
jgi:hypothetical protein